MAFAETYEKWRERKQRELEQVDKATDGELCKKIGDVVKAQADTVKALLGDLSAKNLSAVRTECERLADYLDYADRCKSRPKK